VTNLAFLEAISSKADLLVLLGFGIESRAGEGLHAEAARLLGRLAVTGELEVGVGREGCSAAVGDLVAHIGHVAAAPEGDQLAHLDPIGGGRRVEAQGHRILAVLQLEAGGREVEQGLVIGQAVADQAGLGGVVVLLAVVEEHVVARDVFGGLVAGQLEPDDVAALGRHFRHQHIGADDGLGDHAAGAAAVALCPAGLGCRLPQPPASAWVRRLQNRRSRRRPVPGACCASASRPTA
jgi:hypothetical protein